MEQIFDPINSVADIYSLGERYLLVWCFIYEVDESECSPLLERLKKLDLAGIPSGVLILKSSANDWISTEIPHYSKLPALMPFGGGFCVAVIDSVETFEERIKDVIAFALEIKAQWEKGR